LGVISIGRDVAPVVMHPKGGKAMTPILIVPGLGGSGSHHWQTCLERSFPGTLRVHQDDWDAPDRAAWVERLAAAIEAAPGAVLVAHSLGCALVAHVAAERPSLAIEAALLVAPADVESAHHTPEHIRSFAPIPRGRLGFRSVVVGSTDDPYISLPRARELADAWGAEFVDAGPLGHINIDSGFGPWPAGEGILRRLMTARREPRFLAPATLHA
jgi:predicted alpha/beta hydrolase family esterase